MKQQAKSDYLQRRLDAKYRQEVWFSEVLRAK